MTFQLSQRSLDRLQGVHPDLVKIVRGAILHSLNDFTVVEGLRTLEQQQIYFDTGKSRTMKSRHLTGHAVDLMPLLVKDGKSVGSWELKDFYPLNDAMQLSAHAFGIEVEWGGTCFGPTFIDAPHFQLSWSKYP